MTAEQILDFNKFGCGSRCLMKLSELYGKPINKEEFCQKFSTYFPYPETQYGGTVVSSLIDIARHMGICNGFADTSVDPELCKAAFLNRQTRGVFLITEREKDKNNEICINHHCRLLLNWEDDKLLVWHPNPDGTEREMTLEKEQLPERLANFVLLY